jgi:hypothetical protein
LCSSVLIVVIVVVVVVVVVQRLQILESFVRDSLQNSNLRQEQHNLKELMKSGTVML